MDQINKYILYISVILNGILLMILFGVIPFFLYASILINLGLIWYIKKALEKNNLLETDVSYIMEDVGVFADHLENIHEMEMYYGDKDLQDMIEHSKQLVNEFVDFQVKHFDAVEIEDNEEEELNDEEEKLHDEEKTSKE